MPGRLQIRAPSGSALTQYRRSIPTSRPMVLRRRTASPKRRRPARKWLTSPPAGAETGGQAETAAGPTDAPCPGLAGHPPSPIAGRRRTPPGNDHLARVRPRHAFPLTIDAYGTSRCASSGLKKPPQIRHDPYGRRVSRFLRPSRPSQDAAVSLPAATAVVTHSAANAGSRWPPAARSERIRRLSGDQPGWWFGAGLTG